MIPLTLFLLPSPLLFLLSLSIFSYTVVSFLLPPFFADLVLYCTAAFVTSSAIAIVVGTDAAIVVGTDTTIVVSTGMVVALLHLTLVLLPLTLHHCPLLPPFFADLVLYCAAAFVTGSAITIVVGTHATIVVGTGIIVALLPSMLFLLPLMLHCHPLLSTFFC